MHPRVTSPSYKQLSKTLATLKQSIKFTYSDFPFQFCNLLDSLAGADPRTFSFKDSQNVIKTVTNVDAFAQFIEDCLICSSLMDFKGIFF